MTCAPAAAPPAPGLAEAALGLAGLAATLGLALALAGFAAALGLPTGAAPPQADRVRTASMPAASRFGRHFTSRHRNTCGPLLDLDLHV